MLFVRVSCCCLISRIAVSVNYLRRSVIAVIEFRYLLSVSFI